MTRGHAQKKNRARQETWTMLKVKGCERESEKALREQSGGQEERQKGAADSNRPNGLWISVSNSVTIGTKGLLESVQFKFFTQEL